MTHIEVVREALEWAVPSEWPTSPHGAMRKAQAALAALDSLEAELAQATEQLEANRERAYGDLAVQMGYDFAALQAELAKVRDRADTMKAWADDFKAQRDRYREALERIAARSATPPYMTLNEKNAVRIARAALTGETEPPFDREVDQ